MPDAIVPAPPVDRPVPLVVDLDGTLVRTDLLLESVFMLAKRSPLHLLLVPLWLAGGKACLKRRLAEEARPDVTALPYRPDSARPARGGKAPRPAVGAGDRGRRRRCGGRGAPPRAVRSGARERRQGQSRRGTEARPAGRRVRPARLRLCRQRAERRGAVACRPPGRGHRDCPRPRLQGGEADRGRGDPSRRSAHGGDYLEAIRPHQWLKNALVFLPLLAAHRIYEPDLLSQGLLVLLAFSLCASSAYLLNDLLDLPSDRHHPRKRDRPLASGRLPLVHGLALAPLLLITGLALGALSGPLLLGLLALYYCPDNVLFTAAEGRRDPRCAGARGAVHAAGHGRRGRVRDPALGLAARLLRVPVLQPRDDQALRRAGGDARRRGASRLTHAPICSRTASCSRRSAAPAAISRCSCLPSTSRAMPCTIPASAIS